MKKSNLDYAHGTGHGVGFFLNVHEGPQSITKINKVKIQQGMILSNEPGYYKKNKFGIRIENLVYVNKKNRNLISFDIDTDNLDLIKKNFMWSKLIYDEIYQHKKFLLNHSEFVVTGNPRFDLCSEKFNNFHDKFLEKYKLKEHYDFLIVDFHGEITSEKNAIGHFFDGKATLVVGTHTHIPTNDARILNNGTAYQTDAGMCGDYDSVIGMNKYNSLNRFLKKDSVKHYPSDGEATLSGVIVDCNIETGLANNIKSYFFGGQLNRN